MRRTEAGRTLGGTILNSDLKADLSLNGHGQKQTPMKERLRLHDRFSDSRFSFRPNRAAEQREIDNRHKKGLHFVGDWHTHPEDIPQPSHLDISSMQETVAKSIHSLNGFLMVIVGTKEFPDALSVSLCDGKTICFLKPAL